jgi:putative ABC transport system permease protein
MILTIAFGIGVWCATFSALSSLSGDPLLGRGRDVFHPLVDPTPDSINESDASPPADLTLRDARALYEAAPKGLRVMTSRNWLPLAIEASGRHTARMAVTRGASADFFKFFRIPFLYGRGWTDAEDADHKRVVVLSKHLNQKLFGGRNSVGKAIVVATKTFIVIGVIDTWEMVPRVYDLSDGAFASAEEEFMPFGTWLSLPQDYGYGPMTCWSNEAADRDHNPNSDTCTWVQLWIELHGSQISDYKTFLRNYSLDQKRQGRYSRPPNTRLYDALSWIRLKRAIPDSVRIQYGVANALLFICLLSTAMLQVLKFRCAFKDLGLRRALGASKKIVFTQLLVEGGIVGLFGGLLGLVFAALGMALLKNSPERYAAYISINLIDVSISLALSIAFTIIATAIPALVVTNAPPFRQMSDG